MNNKEIANILKYYKALCVWIINKQELEDNGIDYLFPCLIDKRAEELKLLTYKAINKAISEMDDTERLIIHKKFLSTSKITDKDIYLEIGVKKDKYYQIKKSAVNKIVEELNNFKKLQQKTRSILIPCQLLSL